MISAYNVKALKEMFDIDVAKMGCVMLDVEKIPVQDYLPAEWAYVSTNPDHKWIKGLDAGDHITLLYGLLENANDIREAVDEVLEGWEPSFVRIHDIGSFPSTFEDEPYACIVGHIWVTPELIDAHARLSLLPHIDTFWEYKPHLTLGYVKAEHEDEAIRTLKHSPMDWQLTAKGLNYGRLPDAKSNP
jgi:hypothetical protein